MADGGNVRPELLGAPRAEPAFNAPWPVVALIAALILAHAVRAWLGVDAGRFALAAGDLSAGRWSGLVSHLFVHASWAHVLMNSVFILAFGTPVARYLGTGGRGAMTFLAFFLVCGVLAGAGFAAIAHALAALGLGPVDWGVVGASGAASGLMGAAARLIEGRGRLGRLGGRTVVGMSVAWIVVNVIFGATGLAPGTQGAPVAWQAHILGYFAGLLLILPAGWLAGARAGVNR
ncbi:MAG TPA: rhomboid family intramembrane serine protease [Caulobacteraceae bacterium]